MTAASPSLVALGSNVPAPVEHRQRLYRGVTFLVLLIALAVVISVVFPLMNGHVPNWSTVVSSWIWVAEVLIVIGVIGVIVWMSRSFQGPPASDSARHSRRYYRHHEMADRPASDSAMEVARQRYARGEITENQLDQILGHLRRESATNPPG